ncbi:hypothetical protein PILCRDRAFT_818312 [Piloderma croceum F 1598]|uniref:Uncharacterized protein n=1 Tax=Piloderma croceum (strain F 1598) TaxID=765440 RepID=A0A0C3C4Z9_PILCF|nr:hypothetical protein PILCRDRAFT_818312 [Piloderma croceum F 1598]
MKLSASAGSPDPISCCKVLFRACQISECQDHGVVRSGIWNYEFDRWEKKVLAYRLYRRKSQDSSKTRVDRSSYFCAEDLQRLYGKATCQMWQKWKKN